MASSLSAELYARVREAFRQGETVLCAVSGGADSVALLRLLRLLESEGRIRLYAAHYEHGIRAESSVEDMRFVEALCRELGVPLAVGRGDVPGEAARLGKGIEETARDMRHAFLRAERERIGADVIALAHHADDQAETVLMRLMRGSAGAGAAGMRARENGAARPFLNVRKRSLVQYLEENGWSWREDETNGEGDTIRNALRIHVMPELEKIRPGCVEAIGRFSRLQAEESAYLQALADAWLKESAMVYPFGVFLRLNAPVPVPILRRAIKTVCGKDANFSDIERMRELCAPYGGNPMVSDARGFRAERTQDGLWIRYAVSPPEDTPLADNGVTRFGILGDMTVSACEPIPERDDPFVQVLNADALAGARIRSFREGDRIEPLGMPGKSKLVSDLLREKGIPRPVREYVPMVENGGAILWAVGARVSERAKLTPGCKALRLVWKPTPAMPYGR